MRSIFFLNIFIILIFSTTGCSGKIYPDEKFSFNKKYRDLIKPYRVGDTLRFENISHRTEIFVITGFDSTISNKTSWIIQQKPFKAIGVSYNQLPLRQWKHPVDKGSSAGKIKTSSMEDDGLIGIGITPDDGKQDCQVKFKKFYGFIRDSNNINTAPITANGMMLKDYYKVENFAPELAKDSSDVKTVYVSNDKGIIAYQDQKGNWWARR